MARLIVYFVYFLFALAPSLGFAHLKVISTRTPFGTLYVPQDGKPTHPGIIVLHGSEGGGRAFNALDAQLFAIQGYAALAHCYYQCFQGMEDIYDPKVEFIDISIDNAFEAFKWLKNSDFTRGQKTGIWGASKGAELALLLATLTSKFALESPDAIGAHSVTDVTEQGFSWNWYSKRCYLPPASAWNSMCGTPPPQQGHANPHHSWTWRGSHAEVANGTRIEIERFRKPIFITHGTKDELWSVQKAYNVRATLQAAGLKPEVHIFPNQGHVFSGTAAQQADELMMEFFDRTLKIASALAIHGFRNPPNQ